MIRWFAAVSGLAFAAACGGGGGAPEPPAAGGGVIRFKAAAERGVTPALELEGRTFGSGSTAVVFAHMAPSSQDAWFDFAEEVARRGFLALTFNFRGYGLSEGSRDPARADLDIAAATEEARARGADAVFVVGASMGGTAAVVEAAAHSVAGLVTLSAPQEVGGLDARDDAPRIRAPALFIASRNDPAGAAKSARALYEAARGPRDVQVVGGSAHGTDLLTDPAVDERVRRLIIAFLLDHRG